MKINGVHHYLWRALDQHGMTLGIMASRHRDARAASKFLRKLVKTEQYVPRVPGHCWVGTEDGRPGG